MSGSSPCRTRAPVARGSKPPPATTRRPTLLCVLLRTQLPQPCCRRSQCLLLVTFHVVCLARRTPPRREGLGRDGAGDPVGDTCAALGGGVGVGELPADDPGVPCGLISSGGIGPSPPPPSLPAPPPISRPCPSRCRRPVYKPPQTVHPQPPRCVREREASSARFTQMTRAGSPSSSSPCPEIYQCS